jgi:hypothetical protein
MPRWDLCGEIRQLKKELARVTEERGILKKIGEWGSGSLLVGRVDHMQSLCRFQR